MIMSWYGVVSYLKDGKGGSEGTEVGIRGQVSFCTMLTRRINTDAYLVYTNIT